LSQIIHSGEGFCGSQALVCANKKNTTMKKIVIVYGLIAGAVVATIMMTIMYMYNSGTLNPDNGEVLGYTVMVISLSMIFFGVKSYRDKQSNGTISFGKGLKIGLLITLIAAVMYALAWEYTYAQLGDQFMTKYTQHHFDEMKAKGVSEADLEKEKSRMATMMEWYKNPIVRFGITIMEMAPVGIIITLISAALLRRKEFLPATQPIAS
jgi:hypothetical protein